MTSNANYGAETTGTEVAAGFGEQIRGKYVLLVGVSPESLGEFMALNIAAHNPALFILASRSPSKIKAVIAKLPNINTKAVEVDLSSQASVRKAAQEIKSLTPKLDIIINNAGVNIPEYQVTKEGIEMHLGTNHIGLFLLTNLLMEKVEAAAAASSQKGATRIINLSSAGHRLSPIRFSDYNFEKRIADIPLEERPPPTAPAHFIESEKPYNAFIAYGQSKAANVLYSVSLTQKLKSKGIVSYSLHPGAIWTGLPRQLDETGKAMLKKTVADWKSGDQGASTGIVAAFDPALNDPEGKSPYLEDCQLVEAAGHSVDPVAAEKLWKLSEKLVGEEFNFSS